MNTSEQMHHAEPEHPSGYDKHDVSVIGIALIAVGSVIFLLVSGALLDTFFVFEHEKVSYEQKLQPRDQRLLTLREQEQKRMHGYGFADTAKVMAHIPIDTAIDLLLKERATETATSMATTKKTGTGH